MPKNPAKSIVSRRIGTDATAETSVPIRLSGIGTRVGSVSDVIGTRASAAAVAGISPAALQRYIREENMPPFDVAVRLCEAAGARLEWLATGQDPMKRGDGRVSEGSDSQPLRRDDLKIALQLAAEALGDKSLPPPKHAELVTLIYELLEEGLPQAKILRFARAASS